MSEKKSVGSLILGKWNTKTIVGIAIGAALFAVLMNFGGIKIFTNTSLTTAMIVDVIVGALFGPVPAALTAFLGNFLADLIGGWGFWFDWSIGNGVSAFFVGLIPVYAKQFDEGVFGVKEIIIYVVTVIIGNALAFGAVTPLLTYLFYSQELTITWGQATAALIGNASVQIVIGIPLLLFIANRNKKSSNLTKED